MDQGIQLLIGLVASVTLATLISGGIGYVVARFIIWKNGE